MNALTVFRILHLVDGKGIRQKQDIVKGYIKLSHTTNFLSRRALQGGFKVSSPLYTICMSSGVLCQTLCHKWSDIGNRALD